LKYVWLYRQEETQAAGPVEEEAWTGRWLPERTTEATKAATAATTVNLHDDKHGIKMGIPDAACDDGKVIMGVCYVVGNMCMQGKKTIIIIHVVILKNINLNTYDHHII
jgi:hypothetical protein